MSVPRFKVSCAGTWMAQGGATRPRFQAVAYHVADPPGAPRAWRAASIQAIDMELPTTFVVSRVESCLAVIEAGSESHRKPRALIDQSGTPSSAWTHCVMSQAQAAAGTDDVTVSLSFVTVSKPGYGICARRRYARAGSEARDRGDGPGRRRRRDRHAGATRIAVIGKSRARWR
jgi:hypothetical protein